MYIYIYIYIYIYNVMKWLGFATGHFMLDGILQY